MGDQDLDFEAAMRAMGVRRLEADARPKSKAKRPSRPTPKKSAPKGRAAVARAVPRSTPPRPSPKPPRVQPPPAPVAEPSAALLAELAALKEQVARLEANAAATSRALICEQQRSESLAGELHTATGVVKRLEGALQSSSSPTVTPLSHHLRSRGVLGDSESKQLITALMASGRLDHLAASVAPVAPAEFARWLDENTVLLGDCGQCPSAGSRAVVRVPTARCEVCGGSDIRRDGRKLLDACLNQGITRLTVVGGSPKYHRQLRELIQHHRVKLRLVPGTSRRTRKQARDDIRGSDLVVVWGPTLLAHATSEQYTDQTEHGRVLVVPHRGIGSMLSTVTAALLHPSG